LKRKRHNIILKMMLDRGLRSYESGGYYWDQENMDEDEEMRVDEGDSEEMREMWIWMGLSCRLHVRRHD
jgi:hypothetical protein